MADVNLKALLLILVAASFFRLWAAFDIPKYIEDEGIHVPNAISLGEHGTPSKLNGVHSPLSGLILYGTISLFGDNPHGWRAGNILLGTGSVLLLFLIALRLYPGGYVSPIAAALLAMDPFHAHCSRTTFMEIPSSFFFLLFLYLLLEYCENNRNTLTLAGVALGLTVATKAYFVIAIPVVVLYALYRQRQKGERISALALDFIANLVILPVAVLLLSYLQWFGRGYTLYEFLQMKQDTVHILQSFTRNSFIDISYLEAGGRPWEWFLKPIIHGFQLSADNDRGSFLLQINNFPFRMLVIPSMLLLTIRGVLHRNTRELLVPVLFASCYALFLLVKRPMFSYSALVLLPFAYLALARAVEILTSRIRRGVEVRVVFVTAVLIWGLYTFPLVTFREIPLALYKPLLSVATIHHRN